MQVQTVTTAITSKRSGKVSEGRRIEESLNVKPLLALLAWPRIGAINCGMSMLSALRANG